MRVGGGEGDCFYAYRWSVLLLRLRCEGCCCSAEMGCMLLRMFCFAIEELRVRVRECLGLF